ncbi:hypothetical protein BC835DRAFT_1430723 [Cytidiella melzeri]|nr:hypothetical protein BC835DRAFT_1430723 [Cytidiella melzeri]
MVVQTDTPVKTPEVVTRKVSVSGLNPSSSRFVLRIPLLGRPKTPLQEVIAHPREETLKAKGKFLSSRHISSPSHELAAPAELAPEAAEEPPAANAEGPRASSKDQSAQGSSDTSQSSSTWWTYVGWSPSGSTTEVNNQQPNAEQSSVVPKQAITEPSSSTTPDLQLEQGAESEPSEPTSAITNTPSTTAKEVPSRVAVGEEKETETGKKLGKQQTPSLFFEDTTRSQYSAWYSPWGWYAASPIVPSSSSAPAKSPPKEGQSATEPYQMTESEMVREEALARDAEGFGRPDPAPGVPSDQVLNTVDTSEPPATLNAVSPSPSVNPIESSISSNRSGWASFFMSKALLVKNITDGQEAKAQDQGEMEVMDIDEDDGQKEKVVASTSSPSKPVGIASRKSRSIASTPASTSTSPKVRDSARPPLKEREPKKSGPPAPPLTNSDSIKKETAKVSSGTRPPSPTPSKYSTTPPRLSPPNLVLPTWNDTFQSPPRSLVPPPPTPPVSPLKGKFEKTLDLVSILWSGKNEQDRKDSFKSKGKERQKANPVQQFGMDLPKALDVAGHAFNPKSLNDKCRVVVIGVAGWMPGAITRTLAGGLPSSSSKFVDLTCTALQNFEEEHGFKFQKITKIPLEGDGTIERKLSKIHSHLMGNEEWMRDLHSADVIFVAAHSQGSIVSAHLIDRLIKEGHIMTERNMEIIAQAAASVAPGGIAPSFTSMTRTQKICCLALCGVHLGPLRYLKTSSLLQPYLQYFENAAARELFDFQDTETDVSKNYVKALSNVMDHGTKMLYVASLNDQVVPIYSGLFSAASHPRILRALYIDGDAYHSSDFLSNLLVLLIRIMNTGLSDSGLLAHLSEATAGTLSGVGHSTAYEELASYSLAVNYLFLTNDGGEARQDLVVEPFNAVNEQNDYEIPWSLRDLIADERVAHFFAAEFEQLKDAFNHWSPKTTILRDVKRKLQPIQRLTSIKGSSFGSRL